MASKRSRAAFEADLQAQQSPFAFYGTPLPPVDPSVRDDGSYVPVWKQQVTDERGRRRLHGAFTGGFSAGYFNTVGSKEGWTPSTFVSSRANRDKDGSKPAQQRPEDFMDEEDLAEMAEAQKLHTADSFAGLGTLDDQSSQNGKLMDILRRDKDTIGVKLLQRMGWRQGQGIGPKVRRKARLDDDSERGNEQQEEHLFARENSKVILFTNKTDYKGLGYEGEARLTPRAGALSGDKDSQDEDVDEPALFSRKNNKKPKPKPNRGGFGVGILNDNGSDEEDPYAVGPRLSYNRVITTDKKQKAQGTGKPAVASANPLLSVKPVFKSKKVNVGKPSSTRRCHDGRLPLTGFLLASESLGNAQEKSYIVPKPPPGWVPSRLQAKSNGNDQGTQSARGASGVTAMDAKSRAALLGEAQLPGKSVFDYLSTAARDRLANASGRADLPAALGEAPPPSATTSDLNRPNQFNFAIPHLDKEIAVAALHRGTTGWMPYSDDYKKQARYRAFLEFKGGTSTVTPKCPTDMSRDDWIKELHEFAQAAQVFKPITGAMASRFTSSRAPLGPSGSTQNSQSTLLSSGTAAKVENPAEAAAKLGMYGPMTRSVQNFFPTRLVCKRFNVSQPAHVQHDADGSSAQGAAQPTSSNDRLQLVPKATIEKLMQDSSLDSSMTNPGVGVTKADTGTAAAKVEIERNEALESERPGEAVFRAIFGSDDEDD